MRTQSRSVSRFVTSKLLNPQGKANNLDSQRQGKFYLTWTG